MGRHFHELVVITTALQAEMIRYMDPAVDSTDAEHIARFKELHKELGKWLKAMEKSISG